MSEGVICIAEPNLEVKYQFRFFLLFLLISFHNDVRSHDAIWSVIAVLSDDNSAVNRNLASVIRNWNNCFECFDRLIKSCILLHNQLKLLILKLLIKRYKLLKTVSVLLGDRSLSSVFFNCFWILFHNVTALTINEYFPYVFVL